jgi:hypothetical protein
MPPHQGLAVIAVDQCHVERFRIQDPIRTSPPRTPIAIIATANHLPRSAITTQALHSRHNPGDADHAQGDREGSMTCLSK